MNKFNSPDDHNDCFSHPKMLENYSMLSELGVFKHIDYMNKEIRDYKNLLAGALDIFNRISISEIMDATVWQISNNFLPSFIVFLWKPMQNREDVIIKSYKNHQLVDLNLKVDNISTFEPYFLENPDPVSYENFCRNINTEQNETFKSFGVVQPELIIPILGPMGLYGLVLVGHKMLESGYTSHELAYIQNLMSFVSKAIQNNLHYERTLHDVKTGLYNNGFFINRLSEEIARSKRSQTVTSIIIMDVDKFKRFNDSYGHLAGDKVLESLAITIKQGVRTEDVPSRFGGEEFTVLLPETKADDAWVVAERLRTMVEAMKVQWEPPLPKVTISLGIFTLNKDTDLKAEEIIRRADEALYMSKERGRNQTTIWSPDLNGKKQLLKQQKNLGAEGQKA